RDTKRAARTKKFLLQPSLGIDRIQNCQYMKGLG
mgnify:CR=1